MNKHHLVLVIIIIFLVLVWGGMYLVDHKLFSEGLNMDSNTEYKLKGINPPKDTDGDLIPDKYDEHPLGGGRYIPKVFLWNYEGREITMNTQIHEDWYDYTKKIPRSSLSVRDYIMTQDPTIQDIVRQFNEYMSKNELNCKSCFVITFIQSLPYADDGRTGYDEYPKTPVETLTEGNGDCEDTSFLAASIIKAMGIGVVLIELPQHMAVGIWVEDCPGSYFEHNGKKYCYLETTGEGWKLGEIPEQYKEKEVSIIEV